MGNPIKLVLCWHMHQPYYRSVIDKQYQLPWVYLHAIKDYADMIAHLEAHPKAKAVINFVPVLLEQIDDYRQQLHDYLHHATRMHDPLLNWLAGVDKISKKLSVRTHIIQACQKAHAAQMIDPYPQYKKLLDIVTHLHHPQQLDNESISYLNTQYFIDLLMWYHLAWLGYTVKQHDPRCGVLLAKGKNFNPEDRRTLLSIIHDILDTLLPRYQKLAQAGQIELSMTPYAHPITPLLLDFNSTSCATPQALLPEAAHYPGGKERAKWHIEKGLDCFQHYFQQQPTGVWLAEGAMSEESIQLLDEYHIHWSASGEAVWHNSARKSADPQEHLDKKTTLFSPCQLQQSQCQLFFRDDGLSDLIGFQYKDWNTEDAINDFCQHIQNIASAQAENVQDHVISIIMDGENAWEYYPDNAYHFLDALYRCLTQHPQIELSTFEAIYQQQLPCHTFSSLCAGSWVFGSFSTWMGDKDKNKAWDYLVAAKKAYDKVIASNKLTTEQQQLATQQLAMCESSDWFWWFGDYNPSESVQAFDQLFRQHLLKLYQLLQLEPPIYLDIPISHGGNYADNAGTMRKNT